jgi:hypothetical protein
MSEDPGRSGAQTDEQRARAIREQLKSIHAVDMAYEMMVSLVSFGYQKMGLTAETDELRDMGDARVAIELLRATLGVIERETGEAQTRDLRSTLAQMQLSFAQAVQLGAGADSRPAQRPADAPAQEPTGEPAKQPAGEHAQAASPRPPEAARQEPAAAKPEATKTAAKRPAAKKDAAKRPAAKKDAAKKPSAKKDAAKTPAARKPAQKKRAPRKPGGESPPA